MTSTTHLLPYDQHGWSFLIVFSCGPMLPRLDWNKYFYFTPYSGDDDDPCCPPYTVLGHRVHSYLIVRLLPVCSDNQEPRSLINFHRNKHDSWLDRWQYQNVVNATIINAMRMVISRMWPPPASMGHWQYSSQPPAIV